MAEKNVYILFTDTDTLFTKAIKLYTRKPYNHTSISFDKDLKQLYSFGRKNPNNPFIGGFVQEDIDTDLLKSATCAVYSLAVKETEYDRMQQYIIEIETQKENYCYNLIGLFAILFNKEIKRKNAFFCSEFVASVLTQSTSVDFDIPLSLITPHDLQIIESLELVYQGKLKNYKNNMFSQPYKHMITSPTSVTSTQIS